MRNGGMKSGSISDNEDSVQLLTYLQTPVGIWYKFDK